MSFKQIEQFVSAEKRGEGGSALENAHLGRILGFNTYMGQSVNGISSGADTNSMAITDALAAGVTPAAQDCSTTGTQAVVTGEFLTVAGNDQPTYITAHHETGGDTDTVRPTVPASTQRVGARKSTAMPIPAARLLRLAS